MLTKSDITILMQQVDVTKAYDLLAMFKEAGKERIDIRAVRDFHTCGDDQAPVHLHGIAQESRKRRERLKRHRRRLMLIAQRGKSVICRHEQVLP